MGGDWKEVFIKVICIFKFHYSWVLRTCCPAGASAMWQTQAQGQPPAVSQTIGNHSTLNFPLSCHPPWLLTTPRAPSGAANFLLAPPLTCENSRGLWGEWWASTGPYAGPLMIWHQTAERGEMVAGRLLYCRPFDLTHSGCPAWLLPVGQPERRWPNSRTMAQPFTAGKSFFKDLQEAPVGPGSWHLIWGVWSSWCQSKTLQIIPTAGRLWNCLFIHLPVHPQEKKEPEGDRLAKFSVCKEGVTWAPLTPTHFSLGSQRDKW